MDFEPNTDHIPWIYVRDVPSCGTKSLIRGTKMSRDRHLLSDWEAICFLLLEFQSAAKS